MYALDFIIKKVGYQRKRSSENSNQFWGAHYFPSVAGFINYKEELVSKWILLDLCKNVLKIQQKKTLPHFCDNFPQWTLLDSATALKSDFNALQNVS